jgi:hypothetical protein
LRPNANLSSSALPIIFQFTNMATTNMRILLLRLEISCTATPDHFVSYNPSLMLMSRTLFGKQKH